MRITRPGNHIVIELNDREMERVAKAAEEEGLSVEAWASAVVAVEAGGRQYVRHHLKEKP